MDAAFRLQCDERIARTLDMRAAAYEGKDFDAYLRRLKPKR